jgi:hypothetical protein
LSFLRKAESLKNVGFALCAGKGLHDCENPWPVQIHLRVDAGETSRRLRDV